MKKYYILYAIIVSAFMVNAQTSNIEGSWLIEKIEQDGKIQEASFIFDFKSNGKMETMNMEVGTWKYNKKKNTINMSSELDKDYRGEAKILVLNDVEMTLEKDGANFFYSRINFKEIAMINEFSDLAGTWQIQISDDVLGTLKLELPDSFVFVESQEGMTTTNRSTWIYNPDFNYWLAESYYGQEHYY